VKILPAIVFLRWNHGYFPTHSRWGCPTGTTACLHLHHFLNPGKVWWGMCMILASVAHKQCNYCTFKSQSSERMSPQRRLGAMWEVLQHWLANCAPHGHTRMSQWEKHLKWSEWNRLLCCHWRLQLPSAYDKLANILFNAIQCFISASFSVVIKCPFVAK
jgi:hypothetical protein